jgi:hypothetical protein
MRLIASLIVLMIVPLAEAKSPKAQCKNRCDVNYDFCLKRATTKMAKKACKTDHKICKNSCGK